MFTSPNFLITVHTGLNNEVYLRDTDRKITGKLFGANTFTFTYFPKHNDNNVDSNFIEWNQKTDRSKTPRNFISHAAFFEKVVKHVADQVYSNRSSNNEGFSFLTSKIKQVTAHISTNAFSIENVEIKSFQPPVQRTLKEAHYTGKRRKLFEDFQFAQGHIASLYHPQPAFYYAGLEELKNRLREHEIASSESEVSSSLSSGDDFSEEEDPVLTSSKSLSFRPSFCQRPLGPSKKRKYSDCSNSNNAKIPNNAKKPKNESDA